PSSTAIAAGSAPLRRMISSHARAAWRFSGYGRPWAMTEVSSATTGFRRLSARATDLDRLSFTHSPHPDPLPTLGRGDVLPLHLADLLDGELVVLDLLVERRPGDAEQRGGADLLSLRLAQRLGDRVALQPRDHLGQGLRAL